MIRRMKKTIIAIAAAAAALALGACSSADSTQAAETAGATTSAAAAATCPEPKPIENPDFAAAVGTVQLPAGAQVTSGRWTAVGGKPGMFGAAIDICDPAVKSADDLRPVATAYAKALKASPIAEQIDAVWVSSYQVDGGAAVNEAKVRDPDFQMHLWNGKPSAESEQKNWEALVG